MCIIDGCDLEPCDEWWVAVDLMKPILREGMTPSSNWKITPSSSDFLVQGGLLVVLVECN